MLTVHAHIQANARKNTVARTVQSSEEVERKWMSAMENVAKMFVGPSIACDFIFTWIHHEFINKQRFVIFKNIYNDEATQSFIIRRNG